mgnify:CR=1 FL=1
MFAHLRLGPVTVYDPCCGRGNILDAAKAAGYPTVGSDIKDRGASKRHTFAKGDFLRLRKPPATHGRGLAIVANTPYGDEAEKMVRHALSLPYRHCLFIYPLSWLASEGRYHLFARDHPPTQLLFHSERPTMPPGHMLTDPKAFKNVAIDYFWLHYERGRAPQPPAWIKPRNFA